MHCLLRGACWPCSDQLSSQPCGNSIAAIIRMEATKVTISAAGILALGIVFGAAVLGTEASPSSSSPSPGTVVQPMENGRVFVLYMNTMLSCDADGCKRIGHMFDADLSASAKNLAKELSSLRDDAATSG